MTITTAAKTAKTAKTETTKTTTEKVKIKKEVIMDYNNSINSQNGEINIDKNENNDENNITTKQQRQQEQQQQQGQRRSKRLIEKSKQIIKINNNETSNYFFDENINNIQPRKKKPRIKNNDIQNKLSKVKYIDIKLEESGEEKNIKKEQEEDQEQYLDSELDQTEFLKTEYQKLHKSENQVKEEDNYDHHQSNTNTNNPYVDPFDEQEFLKKYPKDEPGPPGWREIYILVKKMRSYTIAPVDTMGCERLPENIKIKTQEMNEMNGGKNNNISISPKIKQEEQEQEQGVTPQVYRFQLLVALLLSSQTKDQVTAEAVASLRSGLRKDIQTGSIGLTVGNVLATPESEIDVLIGKVGFHKRKAGYLKRVAEILRERSQKNKNNNSSNDNDDDDIPTTLEEILQLPGIGPKMGHLLMHRAWGEVKGIGVDVHVHRLSKMWGWTKQRNEIRKVTNKRKRRRTSDSDSDGDGDYCTKDGIKDIHISNSDSDINSNSRAKKSKPKSLLYNGNKLNEDDPQVTRVLLEQWLPKDLWVDINPTLVGFGQTICPSRGSKCEKCLIANTGLCPNVKIKIKKKIKSKNF